MPLLPRRRPDAGEDEPAGGDDRQSAEIDGEVLRRELVGHPRPQQAQGAHHELKRERFARAAVAADGIAAALRDQVGGSGLAAPEERGLGAALGAAGAVLGAHLTFNARMWALRRWGQTPTGLVEDALAGAAAWALVDRSRRSTQAA